MLKYNNNFLRVFLKSVKFFIPIFFILTILGNIFINNIKKEYETKISFKVGKVDGNQTINPESLAEEIVKQYKSNDISVGYSLDSEGLRFRVTSFSLERLNKITKEINADVVKKLKQNFEKEFFKLENETNETKKIIKKLSELMKPGLKESEKVLFESSIFQLTKHQEELEKRYESHMLKKWEIREDSMLIPVLFWPNKFIIYTFILSTSLMIYTIYILIKIRDMNE